MVQELRDLLREVTTDSPHDDLDLQAVLRSGRRHVRIRRASVVGGTALVVAALVAVPTTLVPLLDRADGGPAGVPTPDGPVLHLSDAESAVQGRDYRTLATYTNENLQRGNGQYFDGVTDDGLVLFSDGPQGIDNRVRYALLDPATGRKDWLPDLPDGIEQASPVELTRDRLVLTSSIYDDAGAGMSSRPQLVILDRATEEWLTVSWPQLPATEEQHVVVGPDDRVYVAVKARAGQPPEGGWPTDAGGEADDADAPGDTYHLWSAPLNNVQDLRDEHMTLGSFAFTDTEMVWTDRTNGDSGLVHVRDLATGEEHAFDPQAGDKCNLLSFGVSGDDVVMGQYCGTYKGGVRDDRVQVVSTDGDQVVTLQDDGMDGGLASAAADGGLVSVTSYQRDEGGTYVYDLATRRLVRVSTATSQYAVGGGTVPSGELMWSTPVNGRLGETQVLAQWLG